MTENNEKKVKPTELKKQPLREMAAPIKMTLEQWVSQLGFFSQNTIAIARMLLETQEFILGLHNLLMDWEKKPKGQTNKHVAKIIKDIRDLMIKSKVQVLKRTPQLPTNLPTPVPMNQQGIQNVGGQFMMKPPGTVLHKNVQPSLKQRSIGRARATMKLKEIVDELPKIDKEKQENGVSDKKKGT